VKCATITPDEQRVEEFGLKKMWKSPNGTIRNILGGVIFREPIVISNIPRLVPGWTKPIVIGRHAHGDQYKATDFKVPGAGTVTMTYVPADGSQPVEMKIFDFGDDGGVVMGMYNYNDSDPRLRSRLAALRPQPQLPGVPVDEEHDPQGLRRPFKDIFEEVYETEFKAEFDAAGLTYEHRLIDDMVACGHEVGGRLRLGLQELRRRRAVRHRGPGLRLARPDDQRADDPGRQDRRGRGRARHGHPPLPRAPEGQQDVDQPDRVDLRLDAGLAYRGKLDGTPEVVAFAQALENVCIEAVEAGEMTKDLALLISKDAPWLTTEDFLDALDRRLQAKMA
jgi:isocitrate dehydrogenase